MAAVTAFLAVLTLAGCSSGPEYTAADCRDLLERNVLADNISDVSKEPECKELSHDEYGDAVETVLIKHKDRIINPGG
ncbi:hypothetical protein [Streptomyces sp. NPDC060366]|uniref:hypothetical protein n=1 Tax=Streptomyces sp. NPDC060366 TaxID=3347105 RepID=UPI00364F4607